MSEGPQLWASDPIGDGSIILAVPLFALGLVCALLLGVAIGGLAMAGRDKRLRQKGHIGHQHPYQRIACTAVKSAYAFDLRDFPEPWQTQVYLAVVDIEDPERDPAENAVNMSAAATERFGTLREAELVLRERAKVDIFGMPSDVMRSILKVAIDLERDGAKAIRKAVLEHWRGLRVAMSAEEDD